ncbi:MAG TPA: thiolase family protein [Spirochaetota bacterium]|nr:thiolase family protein [Spirochaetota bacterium]HPC39664.1 thiolase family protein [Spirochaetota bacterium]HPL17610.1 thiolase family protein [Spirochaetota bacterium]HQF07391.1 thiolase family protein [Spirochaetota bacterium]HQH96651.1 thiolase family protein [Spirochaetota bacterium]
MKDVYIISAARTPVGKQKGYLREYSAPQLLAMVLNEVVSRAALDVSQVDDVITGCVYQIGEQGFNLARMAVLESNLPVTIGGISVNRQCGSGLSAIQLASGMIASGEMDTVIASGCEIMSKYGIASDLNCTLSNGQNAGHPISKGYMERYGIPNQMVAAQAIANQWKITKEECQDFAIASHEKALRAIREGYFKKEILPTRGLDKDGNSFVCETDEPVRAGVTREGLDALKVLPGTDWMSAGLSSTVTDGASAVLLMSGEKAKQLKVPPLARVVASAVVGSDPKLMLTGPITATPKVLAKAGLKMSDIDIFEVNEAFAPIPLAWAKELGADMEKLNVNGGALALGHPVGNSGCRLTVTAIHELMRRKAKYGLVTLCTGGGQAPATIFERV